MPYSIRISQKTPEISHVFTQNSTINMIRSTKQLLSIVEIQENEQIKITNIVFQVEGDDKKGNQIKTIQAKWNILHAQRIITTYFAGESCFYVLKNPFEIYFMHKLSTNAIPIVLNQAIELKQAICLINYPTLFVYGHHAEKYMNYVYAINLTTFQIKQLCNGKGYSPKGRSGYFSLFSDDRLYVFGGKNSKGLKCDQLLWTFDFEKGYWFALEMSYQNAQQIVPAFSCEYESGKVLVINNMGVRLIELYQSKIWNLSEFVPEQLKQMAITGIFDYNGKILMYNSKEILSKCVQIVKQ